MKYGAGDIRRPARGISRATGNLRPPPERPARERGPRAEPSILPGDDDAAVLECLGKHVPPAQFIGTFFKGIWTLKRLARAAKLRVLARKKQAVKAQRSTHRASKTSTGVVLLRQRLENLHLAMRTIAGDGNCQFRAFSQNL
jgi:hypothetical protein